MEPLWVGHVVERVWLCMLVAGSGRLVRGRRGRRGGGSQPQQ